MRYPRPQRRSCRGEARLALHEGRASPAPTLVLLLALFLPACEVERFYGPFQLELPSEIEEQAVARTFALPLSATDRQEVLDLAACQAQDPPPAVPCSCQIPVIRVDEQELRIDYLLSPLADTPTSVMVWIGRELLPEEPPSEDLPDLPTIEVLAAHHYQLLPPREERGAFSEAELRAVDLAWAREVHPECTQGPGDLPAPLRLKVGAALEGATAGLVSITLTFKVSVPD
jgi:hypothetical protein